MPTCSLSCERTGDFGDDVSLVWSTTGGTTAELVDSDGTVISTDLSGSATILRGACKTYTLIVINDCGTTECECTPPAQEVCDCTDCPYEDEMGEHDNPQPPSICVPCGCLRGRGTALAVTVAGVLDEIKNGPFTHAFRIGVGCFFSGCESYGTGVHEFASPAKQWFLGFDIMNDTYLFDLDSASCASCGTFKCTSSPGGYYIGQATVETNTDYFPPCDTFHTWQGTTTLTLDLCIAWSAPTKATPPVFPSSVTCLSGSNRPNFYYRVVSSSGPSLGLDDNWHQFDLGHMSEGITDLCDATYTSVVEPLDDIADSAYFDWSVTSCLQVVFGQGPWYDLLRWPTISGTRLVAIEHVMEYEGVVDFAYTTVGW